MNNILFPYPHSKEEWIKLLESKEEDKIDKIAELVEEGENK